MEPLLDVRVVLALNGIGWTRMVKWVMLGPSFRLYCQLKGVVNRVSHVSEENPSKVPVDLNGNCSFKVMSLVTPLSSAWMERYEPAHQPANPILRLK